MSGEGAFYVCTETSPRCYIIQKVNAKHVDQVINDLAVVSEWEGHASHGTISPPAPPPPPMLPWWFTTECQSQLESVEPSAEMAMPPPSIAETIVANAGPEQVRAQLRNQLEYYFSRENLATDRYLRSQMDNDQYVPIRIIAGFPKVARLTNNLALIVQVLRESPHLQVDELGEKVRSACKRCTIILREIPESTDKRVEEMFRGAPKYVSLDYGLNDSWYVTFETEEATQRAFLHLQMTVKTFRDKPIFARIKTGGAPTSDPMMGGGLTAHNNNNHMNSVESVGDLLPIRPDSLPLTAQPQTNSVPHHHQHQQHHRHGPTSTNFDLGQILASYGYVPRATYRPGATVVHVTTPPPMSIASGRMPSMGRASRAVLHRGRGRGFGSAGNGGSGGGGGGGVGAFRRGDQTRTRSGVARGLNHGGRGTGVSRSRTPNDQSHSAMRQRSASDYQPYYGRSVSAIFYQRSFRHRYNHYNGYASGGRGTTSPSTAPQMDDQEADEETEELLDLDNKMDRDKTTTGSSTNTASPGSSAHHDGLDECDEYNFEASAFPTLTGEEQQSQQAKINPEPPVPTPSKSSSIIGNGGPAAFTQRSWAISFSSVAAGRASARSVDERWLSGQHQPPPVKKSYAQTLKQCSSEHLAGKPSDKQWAHL